MVLTANEKTLYDRQVSVEFGLYNGNLMGWVSSNKDINYGKLVEWLHSKIGIDKITIRIIIYKTIVHSFIDSLI